MRKISLGKIWKTLSEADFKKRFQKTFPNDDWEKAYKSIGGVIKKSEKKGAK